MVEEIAGLPVIIMDGIPEDCILLVPSGAVQVKKIDVQPSKVAIHYKLVKPVAAICNIGRSENGQGGLF